MYNSKKDSTSSNPANPPTLGGSCTIDAAFYLVSTEVALEKANGLASKGSLHRSHAAVAEIQPDATMSEVTQYFRNKGQDYERWIGGMQKMYARHAE